MNIQENIRMPEFLIKMDSDIQNSPHKLWKSSRSSNFPILFFFKLAIFREPGPRTPENACFLIFQYFPEIFVKNLKIIQNFIDANFWQKF